MHENQEAIEKMLLINFINNLLKGRNKTKVIIGYSVKILEGITEIPEEEGLYQYNSVYLLDRKLEHDAIKFTFEVAGETDDDSETKYFSFVLHLRSVENLGVIEFDLEKYVDEINEIL